MEAVPVRWNRIKVAVPAVPAAPVAVVVDLEVLGTRLGARVETKVAQVVPVAAAAAAAAVAVAVAVAVEVEAAISSRGASRISSSEIRP